MVDKYAQLAGDVEMELTASRTSSRITITQEKRRTLSVFQNRVKYPVHLVWNSIRCTARPKVRSMPPCCPKYGPPMEILKGCSGYAAPGQFLAIMGGSGAGKTTMLNILSNRQAYLTGLTITGEVLVNNKDIKSEGFSSFAGYLMQFDILQATLTAFEQLHFTAKFRLYNESQDKREEIVQTMLMDMSLVHCCNEIVGDHLDKKLSGGEKKRVSMAIELLAKPSLLFLDEPTTGLDSMSSIKVLTKVKDLAKVGHTIIATIHQPSTEIYNMFDQLLLMGKGVIVYHGNGLAAKDHFEKLGFPLPEFYNPAEYYINLLSKNWHEEKLRLANPNMPDQEVKDTASQKYENAFQAIQKAYVPNACKLTSFGPLKSDETVAEAGILEAYCFLLKWCTIGRFRTAQFWPWIVGQMIQAGIYVVTYSYLDDNYHSISLRVKCLFLLQMFQITGGMFLVCLDMLRDRLCFERAQMARMYSISTYYFSRLTHYMMLGSFNCMLLSLIIYFSIGLNTEDASHFFIFYVVMLGGFFNACGKTLIVTSLFDSMEAAFALSPVLFVPFFLFAGLLINNADYPDYIVWMKYISDAQYTFSAFVQNEFDNLDLDCSKDSLEEQVKCVDPTNPLNIEFEKGINIMMDFIMAAVVICIGWVLYLRNFAIYRK